MNKIVRKPFNNLRAEMVRNDVDEKYLAEHFGRGVTYIRARLTGKMPWTVDEAFAVCELVNIKREDMPEYFYRSEVDIREQKEGITA